MIAPHKPEPESDQGDDDLGLDLEEQVGLEGDERGFEPEGDEDLELDDAEHAIGLDGQEGLENEEADEDVMLAEDERSWLDEAEPDELAADDDLDEDGERWTEGSEPSDEGFDDDLELPEETGMGLDAGDEGFADDHMLVGLEVEVEALPALDRRAGDDDEGEGESEGGDPFERELLEEIVASVPEESASVGTELIAAAEWKRLRDGVAPPLFGAAGGLCAAWDAGLWLAHASDAAFTKHSAPDSAAQALALCDVGGVAGDLAGSSVHLALATPKGLAVSRDGGRTFKLVPRMGAREPSPAYVAFTRDSRGAALWAAAPFGRLQVLREGSDELVDDGLELPVAKLASDGAHGLLVVGRSDDGALRAVISTDAGRSFKPLALPADSIERVQAVAVAGDTWVCSRRALRPQLLWGRRGEAGMALTAQATPPVALLIERGEPVAYLCESAGDRTTLVRVVLHGKQSLAQRVGAVPKDLGTPLSLVASCGPNGTTLVHIAGTRALYRVTLTAPIDS